MHTSEWRTDVADSTSTKRCRLMQALALSLRHNWPVAALALALLVGMIAPLAAGLSTPSFYVEVLLGGLMSGVLYSLVALGFVLIFKASGVFNFAQGAIVLFAALSFARLSEFMPLVIAFAFSVLIMIALAYAIEFLVLRHLVNQEG